MLRCIGKPRKPADPDWCDESIWLPLTAAPQPVISEASAQLEVALVVAHCAQDLSWLRAEVERMHACGTVRLRIRSIHIYSKCGVDVPADILPAGAVVVRIENVGRCDHSYAYHLAMTPPAKLYDMVVFLKDSYYANRKHGLRDVLDVCHFAAAATRNGMGFGCGMGAYVMTNEEAVGNTTLSIQWSNWHLSSALGRYNMARYSPFSKGQGNPAVPFRSHFSSLRQWVASSKILPRHDAYMMFSEALMPVCYGGQFAFLTENLKLRPKRTWHALRSSLSRGDNIEEGHMAERIWAALLAKKMPLPGWSTLSREMACRTFYYQNAPPFSGMLGGCLIKT